MIRDPGGKNAPRFLTYTVATPQASIAMASNSPNKTALTIHFTACARDAGRFSNACAAAGPANTITQTGVCGKAEPRIEKSQPFAAGTAIPKAATTRR